MPVDHGQYAPGRNKPNPHILLTMKDSLNELKLSGSFREKIKSVFPNGESWLQQLPDLFNRCAQQWQLSDFKIPSGLSYNFICFAESATYGPVALKIGVPHEDIYIQMDSIACFNEKYVCRLYAADKAYCAVLLERIIPGNDLTSVQSLKERAEIAAPLIKHIPVDRFNTSRFPTYGGWLNTAFGKVKNARAGQHDLLQLVDKAALMFRSLPSDNTEQRMLHGDLHHFNILFDQQHNTWKAIDTHGVIGYFALEAARFIGNQMGMEKNGHDARNALLSLSGVFAKALNVPPDKIMTCAFIDTILSTCWTTEESIPDEQEIFKGIAYANIILSCLE